MYWSGNLVGDTIFLVVNNKSATFYIFISIFNRIRRPRCLRAMSLLGGLRDKLAGFLRPFSTNKHLRYGLPFISLLVGSTFAIKEIRQGW